MGTCCAQQRIDPNAPSVEQAAAVPDGPPPPETHEQMAVLRGHQSRRAARKADDPTGSETAGPEMTPEPAASAGPAKRGYAARRAERASGNGKTPEQYLLGTESEGGRDNLNSIADVFEADWGAKDGAPRKEWASTRAAKRQNEAADQDSGARKPKEAGAASARRRYQAAKEAAAREKEEAASASPPPDEREAAEREHKDRVRASTRIQKVVRGNITRERTRIELASELETTRREVSSARAAMAGLSSLPAGSVEDSGSDGELFEF